MLLNSNSSQTTLDLQPGFRPISVLYIEDNAADRVLVRQLLSEMKGEYFSLHFAERLSEGIDAIKRVLPDVVLLDFNLPDSSGIDTLKEFLKRVPDMPVVALTSMYDEALGLEAIKEGARDFLIKCDVEPEALARALCNAAEKP